MAGSIFSHLSGKDNWKSTSKRWVGGGNSYTYNTAFNYGGGSESFENVGFEENSCWSNQMEGLNGMYGYSENGGGVAKKRVMVVVDQSSWSKHAMMWALTHVTNKADMLTLLHVISPSEAGSSDSSNAHLATSLGSLCKACKPEVEVEALVIQGPKLSTVLSQVKKLEVSVLVLGQKKPSPIMSCLFGMSSSEGFVEQCINSAECLTIGVRKQSKGMGGYLISTRWQKNFWLLA